MRVRTDEYVADGVALPGYEFVFLLVLDRKWLLVYLFALSFHSIFLPLCDRPIGSMCTAIMKWNAGACMHGFGLWCASL